jgi:NADH:ubiquinone oxidoreductase subunit F (NADH-binding)
VTLPALSAPRLAGAAGAAPAREVPPPARQQAAGGAPVGLPRLLQAGVGPSYPAHLERFGPLPVAGPNLVGAVTASGLRGRGGARFPTGRKMAAVATRRGPAVLVANGTEGEPLSNKDRALMTANPHLVLDGLWAAATAIGANRMILAIEEARADSAAAVRRALEERRHHPDVDLVLTPGRYVTGQETALVRFIEDGDARPRFGSRPYERGVGGRPTLVANVETLAHVGLIARFGGEWFRSVGPDDEPGSALVTVAGGVRLPGVYEIPVGYPLGDLLRQVEAEPVQAVLIGGYYGAWLDADQAAMARLSTSGLAPLGASPGSGVIVALPADACAWSEVTAVAGWYAAHSSGQCGPCRFGLADIARAFLALTGGDPGAEAAARRWAAMVRGRGACRFPDGAARFVESALDALEVEVSDHARGRCRRRHAGYLPVPPPRPSP